MENSDDKSSKKIEIEIIPISPEENEYKFININEGNESYIHIYFNDDEKKK